MSKDDALTKLLSAADEIKLFLEKCEKEGLIESANVLSQLSRLTFTNLGWTDERILKACKRRFLTEFSKIKGRMSGFRPVNPAMFPDGDFSLNVKFMEIPFVINYSVYGVSCLLSSTYDSSAGNVKTGLYTRLFEGWRIRETGEADTVDGWVAMTKKFVADLMPDNIYILKDEFQLSLPDILRAFPRFRGGFVPDELEKDDMEAIYDDHLGWLRRA